MRDSLSLVVGIDSLTTVFLLSLRVATVFLMTPILYVMAVPVTVRVILVLSLSVVLAVGLSGAGMPLPAPLETGALLQAALIEVALGATLALGILCAFAAFAVAGHLLDVQIGFGIAQVFDPVTRRQLPLIASAFNQLAVVVFFLVNGHHALLRGLAYSLERFPVGKPWPIGEAAPLILAQAGKLFSLGFALAAPVVFCLLLVELALGVVARNLPQMNMFVMGIPIKIVVGLAALSLWFIGVGDVMTRVYASIYETWNAMFALPVPLMPATLGGP